jgi:serine protease AprX
VAKKGTGGTRRAQGGGSKGKVPEADQSGVGERIEQFSIPADLVEHLLLGPADDRRVLQDSPLLGDVWTTYARDAGVDQDVLITPHRRATAAGVADVVRRAIPIREAERDMETQAANTQGLDRPAPRLPDRRAKIAYLQGLVGAKLYFDEVLRILVPMTLWWHEPKVQDRVTQLGDPNARIGTSGKNGQTRLRELLASAKKGERSKPDTENYSSLERYIALAGLIFWVGKLKRPVAADTPLPPLDIDGAFALYEPYIDEIISGMFGLYTTVMSTPDVVQGARDDGEDDDRGSIFQVSLNRDATPSLDRSVPAVKADAARTLFKVNCERIVWAVLDSGIDQNHPALCREVKKAESEAAGGSTREAANESGSEGKTAIRIERISRVLKTFDFTRIREIVSVEEGDADEHIQTFVQTTGRDEAAIKSDLKEIADHAKEKRPTNWAAIERLITLKSPTSPQSPHGTHVAGIIGAKGREGESGEHDGMCPDIRFYDFRVLGKTLKETEFAIIAALQFIRYINERHSYITVHGANLSLSIPHNVRNYACGRTPICNECERLVESGVVVVAAAGNRGYQKFETDSGPFENYAAFSITDPGNADGVITVGSTHGNWPHTYGVSFFSSRGPTGDGRMKPDLVAPGERVQSTVLENDWGAESGTSMAAPHVSGAAAMLLARYEELIGQPRRVKEILCKSATDLGRERSFQGHGMLDVLRAFQSI